MKYRALIPTLALLVSALSVDSATAATIRVPQDQPTIQAGINAANNGDTVLVSPGTYSEAINFNGKAITVRSSNGPKVTIIDGGGTSNDVTFQSNETLTSVLSGFTIQNGTTGIYFGSSSATIKENIIQNNSVCSGGAGIQVFSASPVIQGNIIRNNSQGFGCIGGGGVLLGGNGAAQVIGNQIYDNSWRGDGGGITLDAAGTPIIENNFIYRNSAIQGGGIYMVNYSDATIVQNLIVDNTATQGGGIYFEVPDEGYGPLLVNNTIAGANGVTQGSAVWVGGFSGLTQFFNNIMVGLPSQNAVWCDTMFNRPPPVFTNNDAWSANGTGLQGTCASQAGQNGNLSLNPQFASPFTGNFQLQKTSPAINSGDNSAPDLPNKDLAGNPRIVGGIV